jgi:hypothetical protein
VLGHGDDFLKEVCARTVHAFVTRKIDSYMDRAIGCAKPARAVEYSLRPSYRMRLTACAPGEVVEPALLIKPRIPRAPKLPEFSLYPLGRTSGRPEAPEFISEPPPEWSSWSSIARELEVVTGGAEEASLSPPPEAEEEVAPPSRLDRARAYLNQPHGAANALGLGAAAGLVVASFLLFACK